MKDDNNITNTYEIPVNNAQINGSQYEENIKLLNQGDQNGNTSLMLAVLKKDTDLIRDLLEQGADPNIANNNKNTPLMMACNLTSPEEEEKSLEIIKMLTENGAEYSLVNCYKENVLYFAIRYATRNVLSKLLEKIERHHLEDIINNENYKKYTPLMVAKQYTDICFVDLLTKASLDINDCHLIDRRESQHRNNRFFPYADGKTNGNILGCKVERRCRK